MTWLYLALVVLAAVYLALLPRLVAIQVIRYMSKALEQRLRDGRGDVER